MLYHEECLHSDAQGVMFDNAKKEQYIYYSVYVRGKMYVCVCVCVCVCVLVCVSVCMYVCT